MLDWWNSLHTGNKIALATLLVAVLGVIVTWSSNQSNTINQTITDGNIVYQQSENNANIQNQNIYYGLTFEEYERGLKRPETEIRAGSGQTDGKNPKEAETELSNIQQQLQDTKSSYVNYLEKNCLLLGSRIEKPIEVKKGICFINENKSNPSIIKNVIRNAVIYSNYKGEEITCLLGDTCSFGWPNSPKFHVNFSGYPDEKMYLSNAD